MSIPRTRPKSICAKEKSKNLRKPIFDGSLDNIDDGTISGSLMTISGERPFLCGPLPVTKPNLLAWFMRGTKNGKRHEKLIPNEYKRGKRLNETKEALEARKLSEDYHVRREEMRTLAYKFELQTATMDEYGRLVPITDEDARGLNVQMARPNFRQNINGRVNARNNHNHDNVNRNVNRDNANGGNPGEGENPQRGGGEEVEDDGLGLGMGFLGGVFGFGAQEMNEEDEATRRFIERQENEAAQAIDEVVQRYRTMGVPEHEFEFIRVTPRVDERQNLTARRIIIAIFCVIAAFMCILIQTINLFGVVKSREPDFDQLIHELMEVQPFGSHVEECKNLHRQNMVGLNSTDNGGLFGSLFGSHSQMRMKYNKMEKQYELDCAEGVLHVPSKGTLAKLDREAMESTKEESLRHLYAPYKNGVNASWFHECAWAERHTSNCVLRRHVQATDDSISSETCSAVDESMAEKLSSRLSCFRGVHDGIVTDGEVEDVVKLAGDLVKGGRDHITIHNDTETLINRVPGLIHKLEDLYASYGVVDIKPVAFQINIALPIVHSGGTSKQPANETKKLIAAINETLYKEWASQIKSMNILPMFNLQRPFRDSCVLLSDLEANSQFAFHTSIFLSEGFYGGAVLYVDNHESNTNPAKKVQRGTLVDGSRGRVIVSSGGEDNLRCRTPMRQGIRAVLNIWWDCID